MAHNTIEIGEFAELYILKVCQLSSPISINGFLTSFVAFQMTDNAGYFDLSGLYAMYCDFVTKFQPDFNGVESNIAWTYERTFTANVYIVCTDGSSMEWSI